MTNFTEILLNIALIIFITKEVKNYIKLKKSESKVKSIFDGLHKSIDEHLANEKSKAGRPKGSKNKIN
jgi:hypothetical protein